MKLYVIAENYKNLVDLMENEDIGIEVVKEALESVQGDLVDKLENITKFIKSIEADVEGLKAEEKRLAERRKALENKAKGLKEYMQNCMLLAETKKVKGTLFSFNIQKNPASVNVANTDNIPNEFIKEEVVVNVDKKGLKKYIEEGNVVEGVTLQASESLRIR